MIIKKLNFPVSLFLSLVLVISASVTIGCSSISSIKDAGTKIISDLTQSTEDEGNPDWWKKQPDLEEEKEAINNTTSELTEAFNGKDIEQAVNHIAPVERDKYRELFSQYPDIMPEIAKDLNNATINYLSSEGPYGRFAEYVISLDGHSFSIIFIKIDDEWFMQTL